jgi:hypothetical protein
MKTKLYSQLTVKKRIEFNRILKDCRENCQRQKELMTELWIKPIDDRIKFIDKVKKNEITLEKFQEIQDKITEYQKKTMVDIRKTK